MAYELGSNMSSFHFSTIELSTSELWIPAVTLQLITPYRFELMNTFSRTPFCNCIPPLYFLNLHHDHIHLCCNNPNIRFLCTLPTDLSVFFRFMAAYDYCKSCVIGVTAALCIYTLILILLEFNENNSIQNGSTTETSGFSNPQILSNDSIKYKHHLFNDRDVVTRIDVTPRLRTVSFSMVLQFLLLFSF